MPAIYHAKNIDELFEQAVDATQNQFKEDYQLTADFPILLIPSLSAGNARDGIIEMYMAGSGAIFRRTITQRKRERHDKERDTELTFSPEIELPEKTVKVDFSSALWFPERITLLGDPEFYNIRTLKRQGLVTSLKYVCPRANPTLTTFIEVLTNHRIPSFWGKNLNWIEFGVNVGMYNPADGLFGHLKQAIKRTGDNLEKAIALFE